MSIVGWSGIPDELLHKIDFYSTPREFIKNQRVEGVFNPLTVGSMVVEALNGR